MVILRRLKRFDFYLWSQISKVEDWVAQALGDSRHSIWLRDIFRLTSNSDYVEYECEWHRKCWAFIKHFPSNSNCTNAIAMSQLDSFVYQRKIFIARHFLCPTQRSALDWWLLNLALLHFTLHCRGDCEQCPSLIFQHDILNIVSSRFSFFFLKTLLHVKILELHDSVGRAVNFSSAQRWTWF